MKLSVGLAARLVAFAALATAAACGAPTSEHARAARSEGFTLEVFAAEEAQVYLVRHSDGRQTAARVVEGVSEVMPAPDAAALIARRAEAFETPANEDVSIQAPGFRLSVSADETEGTTDRARIAIDAGGRSVTVDAEGDEPNGRAVVRIAGASESDARDFINEADRLSAETRREMLLALRL